MTLRSLEKIIAHSMFVSDNRTAAGACVRRNVNAQRTHARMNLGPEDTPSEFARAMKDVLVREASTLLSSSVIALCYAWHNSRRFCPFFIMIGMIESGNSRDQEQ